MSALGCDPLCVVISAWLKFHTPPELIKLRFLQKAILVSLVIDFIPMVQNISNTTSTNMKKNI